MVKSNATEDGAESFETKAKLYWTKAKLDKVVGRKKLILYPHEGAWLLRNLGLLNSDASMSADSVRKFLQINHLLHLIKPHLDNLAERFATIYIADLCCGKSYLAFLTVWYLKQWSGGPSKKSNCCYRYIALSADGVYAASGNAILKRSGVNWSVMSTFKVELDAAQFVGNSSAFFAVANNSIVYLAKERS